MRGAARSGRGRPARELAESGGQTKKHFMTYIFMLGFGMGNRVGQNGLGNGFEGGGVKRGKWRGGEGQPRGGEAQAGGGQQALAGGRRKAFSEFSEFSEFFRIFQVFFRSIFRVFRVFRVFRAGRPSASSPFSPRRSFWVARQPGAPRISSAGRLEQSAPPLRCAWLRPRIGPGIGISQTQTSEGTEAGSAQSVLNLIEQGPGKDKSHWIGAQR